MANVLNISKGTFYKVATPIETKKYAGASSCGNKEFFKKCKTKFKGELIPYKEWKEIIEECLKETVYEVLHSKHGFVLPNRIGTFKVQAKQMRSSFIYFITENGKHIKKKDFNFDTFQKYFTFDWIQPHEGMRMGFKNFYKFRAARDTNRAIKPIVTSGGIYANKEQNKNYSKF